MYSCINVSSISIRSSGWFVFFSNAAASTDIYPLSLHDALPIWSGWTAQNSSMPAPRKAMGRQDQPPPLGLRTRSPWRSEEHTSELQSHVNLVCRLLLEKKNIATSVPTLTSHPTPRLSLYSCINV